MTPTQSCRGSDAMTVVRVKGFQIFADRHGRMRCYHRKTKTPVDLTAAPLGTAEFFAECARIAEAGKLALPPKPGTLGLLITEYKNTRRLPTWLNTPALITNASSITCGQSRTRLLPVLIRRWWRASATRQRKAANAASAIT